MLHAAIVGLGWWGKQVHASLAGSEKIEIVCGVDIAPGSLSAFAEATGLPLVADYRAVLNDPDIDAVILTTPHGLHEKQVLAAAASAKQVFCEKPLALNAAAAERMLAACDEKGLVLGIGHERRYERALEEMKRMADEGELGTLLHVEVNWSYNRFVNAPATSWRKDPEQAPAGTLTALGVHMTDYLQSVAGPVAELTARAAHRSSDYADDDILSIQLAFESGVSGYLCTLATTPFYQRIGLFGDRGWVETREVSNIDAPDPAVLTWCSMDEEFRTRTYKHADTVRANLEAWADAAMGNGVYRFTRAQKLHNVEILEAIVTSAKTCATVPVG